MMSESMISLGSPGPSQPGLKPVGLPTRLLSSSSTSRSESGSPKPKVVIVREYDAKPDDDSAFATGSGTIRHEPESSSGQERRWRLTGSACASEKGSVSSVGVTAQDGRRSPATLQRRFMRLRDDASCWAEEEAVKRPASVPVCLSPPGDDDGVSSEAVDSDPPPPTNNSGSARRNVKPVRRRRSMDRTQRYLKFGTSARPSEEPPMTLQWREPVHARPRPSGGAARPQAVPVSELELTRGEAICLSQLRDALDLEDVSRVIFIVQSVANRSEAEWRRLFSLLGVHHQRLLVKHQLHPTGAGPLPDGDSRHTATMKDIEVDSIIYRHHLNNINYHIDRISAEQERQSLPSMSQELNHDSGDAVEDVRMRYETELSLLKQQNQAHPNRESVLQQKCDSLESQLKKANNEISFLKDQVHGLRVQLGVWPDRVTQLEEENATLKEKLSDCRAANQQCRRDLMATQDRLQETLHQQQFSSTSPTNNNHHAESRLSSSDHRLLQRVLEDYDALQREHDRVRAALAETEGRLYDARNESCEHAKRVATLEVDVQRLETETHALRRRSLYEMARPATSVSNYNGMKEREVSPTASLRQRSTSRPSLFRDLSLDRQTVAELSREDGSPDDKRCSRRDLHRFCATAHATLHTFDDPGLTGVDLMSMSLPPAALEAALSSSGRETPRPHSPPVRIPAGTRGPLSYHDVKMIERQYDQLQQEKRRLEAALSHLPARALNPRMRRECRQERERLEASLEATDRQIGSLRMTLRQFNVLKPCA